MVGDFSLIKKGSINRNEHVPLQIIQGGKATLSQRSKSIISPTSSTWKKANPFSETIKEF